MAFDPADDMDSFGRGIERLQRQTTFTEEGETVTEFADVFSGDFTPRIPTTDGVDDEVDDPGDDGGGDDDGGDDGQGPPPEVPNPGTGECVGCGAPRGAGGVSVRVETGQEDGEEEDCDLEEGADQAVEFVTSLGQERPTCGLAWILLAGAGLLTLSIVTEGGGS